jgi:hypothetical protein
MSDGSTVRLPIPPTTGRSRRGGRRVWWIVLASLLALVVLLIVLDRVAVAYADNQAAQQMKSQGFPTKPNVSIQGFPFLTQVLSRNLNDIHITASNIQEGPVTLSLVADATDVKLDPGFQRGTITHINGTGVIGFSSLASAGGIAGAPGLSLKAAGPNAVKITVDLQVFTASALATITRTGPDTFRVHISSTNGIPASVLGSFRDFTVHIPALPMNLSIQSVTVSSKGVLIHVTGNNVKFTQNGLG